MTYTPIRKCSSFWTWLYFRRRMFGNTATMLRVCGWDSYGDPRFGFK